VNRQLVALLVGPEPSASIREIAIAARDAYELVFFADADEIGPDYLRAASSVGRVVAGSRDGWPDAVRHAGVDGVATFSDSEVENLDDVAAHCALPTTAGKVPNRWRKFEQRSLLNSVGASSTPARKVASCADLQRAVQELGAPGLLKPQRAASSRGIVAVTSTTGVDQAWRQRTSGIDYHYERYIPGIEMAPGLAPFVSVDTACHDGKKFHFGFNDKLCLLDGFLETGVVGPTQLDEESIRLTLSAVDAALDALGIDNLLTHSEVRLSPDGPQVIEVNGRLGGFVQGLSRRMTGDDACRAALDVAAGNPPTLAHPDFADQPVSRSTPHAAALMLPLKTGDRDVANRALQVMRATELGSSFEMPAPVSETFRTALAWFTGTDRESVLRSVSDTIRSASQDPVLSAVLDEDWVAQMVPPLGFEPRLNRF
jgi:hypothetical protein